MGGCCNTRDRNDMVMGIETRNNAIFYYNYPQMIKVVKRRLHEIKKIEGTLSSMDISYLKWAYTQMQMEISYNQQNLVEESKRKYPKRVSIELGEGWGFIKTGSQYSSCRTLIRVSFRGKVKQTKKNVNCQTPKFYEQFTFAVTPMDQEDGDSILIQVINVEKSGAWRLIAQTQLREENFKDQLVHEDTIEIPMLKQLEVIENPEFKHEDMISDFSYAVDDNSKHDLSTGNFEAKGGDMETLNRSENVNEVDDSHGWLKDHILESPTRDRLLDTQNQEQGVSDQFIHLKVKVQFISDAKEYIRNYIKQYEQLRDNLRAEIDKRLPEIMTTDPIKGQEIKDSLERQVY